MAKAGDYHHEAPQSPSQAGDYSYGAARVAATGYVNRTSAGIMPELPVLHQATYMAQELHAPYQPPQADGPVPPWAMQCQQPYHKQQASGPVPPGAMQTRAPVPWSTGLCDCCVDIPNCCFTCWCPCVTFGQIAEIVDQGTTSCGQNTLVYYLIQQFTGCAHMYSRFYRTKMRVSYNLEGSLLCDMLSHSFCEPCALCQEYRELKNRSFDPSIGWQGNLARQTAPSTMVPPNVAMGMSR